MATIIHIQELTSTQVSEVTANNVQNAFKAYAKNAAFDWSELRNYFMRHYDDRADNSFRIAVFYFQTEKLTIRHVYGNRYIAEWVNI